MTSKASMSGLDYDSEKTRFGFYLPTLTSANLDTVVAQVGAIQTAVNAIVLGEFDGLTVKVSEVKPSSVPTNQYAQRESKWRVAYTDDSNPLGDGHFEIGMPDLTKLSSGTNKADLTDTDIAAFVSALEGAAVSRLGNTITVVEMVHVGRTI